MNGKRAKALRRFRAGVIRGDDLVRLSRTEFRPETQPKQQPERKKKRNGLHPLARAARRVVR
jgi:hypothetical protein